MTPPPGGVCFPMDTNNENDTRGSDRRLTVARPGAAEGAVWLRESWRLFKLAPIAWMGMTALVFLVMLLLGNYLHAGLVEILSPFMVAGFMAGSQAAQRGEPVTFLALGEGFKRSAAALLGIGVIYFAGTLALDYLARQISGTGIEQLALMARQDPASIDPEQARVALEQSLPGLLTVMLLMTPLLMATWFAPALALFNGFNALNSLWWSLWATAVNWRPMAMYVAVFMPLGLIAVLIPFGLGLLVFLPMFLIATFLAYRAMFVTVTRA
jgi:uncharacterized membrane protein